MYIAAVEALRKNRMKLNLPPKLQRKLVWCSQSLCFVKFSFPVPPLMLYYAETTVLAPLVVGLYTDNSITIQFSM
jgi:hypothetical protein